MLKKPSHLITYTDQCVHGTLPPCSCGCPANFNVKSFMRKVSGGNYNGAYRILVNELIFPEISVLLCEGACGKDCAENIDILALEKACIEFAVKKEPIQFSVSPKKERVAVIGAGISGLACALRLASRGFAITVFDSSGEIGGSLEDSIEKEIYLPAIHRQFMHAPISFVGNQTITDAGELASFEAVYIATGKTGNDFDLHKGWDSQCMATTRDGWFLGGELTGVTKFEALVHGRIAATSIEKYLLLSGSMKGVPETFIQRECLFEAKNSGAESIPHPFGFTAEGAKEEAKRCRYCDCTICFDQCEFIRSLNAYPRKIEEIVIASQNPDGLTDQVGSRMVFTCSACGHCGSVCPKGVSLEKLFIGAKKILQDIGKFPPQLHAFYLNDMEDANGKNYLLRLPDGFESAGYLFFPGCQASMSGTDHIKAAYGYLIKRHPDSALMLGCCGVPALWSGREDLFVGARDRILGVWEKLGKPTAVLMCPTCMKTIREHLPQINCVSLYEILAREGMPEGFRRNQQGVAAIFDPCSSRLFPDMQEAVRTLAEKSGFGLEELADSRATARCCGMGGHIYASNRDLALQITATSAGQSDLPYITYCENCRNVFLLEGKACRHVLDDIFNLQPLDRLPHIDELKRNRAALKEELTGCKAEESASGSGKQFKLEIPEELYDKMDRNLISADEIRDTVRYCEESGNRFRNEERGTYIGCCKKGYITYWAEYRKPDCGDYKLINAYCHRINIGGMS